MHMCSIQEMYIVVLQTLQICNRSDLQLSATEHIHDVAVHENG